jgi:hypothetical protein
MQLDYTRAWLALSGRPLLHLADAGPAAEQAGAAAAAGGGEGGLGVLRAALASVAAYADDAALEPVRGRLMAKGAVQGLKKGKGAKDTQVRSLRRRGPGRGCAAARRRALTKNPPPRPAT